MKITAFEPIGPGKFGSRADRRVYRITLDGCEECGDVEGPGWYGMITGRILGLARAGAILREDSDGFISVNYYNDARALLDNWTRTEEHCATFYDGVA